jgi:hypothetical protein
MHAPGIPAIALALLLCVLVSGCASDSMDGLLGTPAVVATPLPLTPAAPLPAAPPATVPPAATLATPFPTTEPVQVLPPERQVSLLLTKDRPTSEIHLLFQGGPGEISINRIMMRVYFTNTSYTEYIMSNGAKPIPGDEIVAPGTRGGDRCEVFVISAGSRYKLIDQRVYGGMYY